MVGRRLDEGFHLARFGDIGGLREDGRSEFGGGVIEPFVVSRADRHAAAFGEQALGDCGAEAMAPPGDRSDAALETEIQRLADLLSFGDRRNFRRRCAPADQGLLGLRVEEVQVVRVDGHLNVLPGLDVAAARVHAGG